MLILQLISHQSFQKFSENFCFLLTKTCVKVSDMTSDIAQVIKIYIYLSGAESNDPLHIVYVPNLFKLT